MVERRAACGCSRVSPQLCSLLRIFLGFLNLLSWFFGCIRLFSTVDCYEMDNSSTFFGVFRRNLRCFVGSSRHGCSDAQRCVTLDSGQIYCYRYASMVPGQIVFFVVVLRSWG